ncbi:MAG: hypothetical protein ACJAVI_003068 [Candidatus Azotimanducaceae bacterium]|jgi:hypothetical protein
MIKTLYSLASFQGRYTILQASPHAYMINFSVDDIDALLTQLSASDVKVDEKNNDEHGKLGWYLA